MATSYSHAPRLLWTTFQMGGWNDLKCMENVLDKHGPWRFYLYYEITEISYTHRTNIRAHMEHWILILGKFIANVHALEHVNYIFLHVLPFDHSDVMVGTYRMRHSVWCFIKRRSMHPPMPYDITESDAVLVCGVDGGWLAFITVSFLLSNLRPSSLYR